MQIKKIGFTLENCDYITIDGKHVGDISLSDIQTSIRRIASNAIEKMETCNDFSIEIHKDANVTHKQFGCDTGEIGVFERLMFSPDITRITVTLVNKLEPMISREEKFDYYVTWTGDSDWISTAQKTYLSKCGNLYIVIHPQKDISDYFLVDEIDDEEEVDTRFTLWGTANTVL